MFGGIKFRDVIAGAAKAVDEQLTKTRKIRTVRSR